MQIQKNCRLLIALDAHTAYSFGDLLLAYISYAVHVLCLYNTGILGTAHKDCYLERTL